MEYTLSFPGGMIRERVVDGVSTKMYMLKDHNGQWQQVAYEVWDDARKQAEQQKAKE